MKSLEDQYEEEALQLCNVMEYPDPNYVGHSDSENLMQAPSK
jgi:hypothetical protein